MISLLALSSPKPTFHSVPFIFQLKDETVGEGVGELVGEGVGEGVGETVGEGVGETVGEGVGELVGESVGEGVGETVGGEGVHSSESPIFAFVVPENIPVLSTLSDTFQHNVCLNATALENI